jgi:hypothetical protein
MSRFRKKSLAAFLGATIAIAGVGVAYAYWTGGGSGTGSASTGTGQEIVANQTSKISDMRPGDSPQSLSGNFDNFNAGPIFVNVVTVSIADVIKADGASDGPCSAADYTLLNPEMVVNAQIDAGEAVGSWGYPEKTATIQFNNTEDNQDGCKGARVVLSYAIS